MACVVALITSVSTTDAAIIMRRMSGDDLHWTGAVPPAVVGQVYNWSADIYLTSDLTGGIVWLRSDYRDRAWVVQESAMHPPGSWLLHGEDLSLELQGGLPSKPLEASIQWWPKEYNPQNYVTSLEASGRLWEVTPGVIVPEPALTLGVLVALVLILLGLRS